MSLSRIVANSIANGTVVASEFADNTITSIKMANTGVVAATYGNATVVPVITVDNAGRITTASTATISTTVANTNITGNIIASQITSVANTQLTGNITSSQIEPTGVTAALYGGTTAIPVITIDQQGRVTAASNVEVAPSISLGLVRAIATNCILP